MNQKNIEIETKLYVPDLQVIALRLDASGATLTKPRVFERNVRYENVDGTLTQQDIVLRLRQDSRIRLTYKEPRDINAGEGISTRFEAEVEVGDFDTMQLILERLGYHSFLVYEKWRTTYTLLDGEIVLDQLPFGDFVEIEGPEQTIHRIIPLLGLQDMPRFALSYTALFNHVKQELQLSFQDLTFENFSNIEVPAQVYRGLT